MSYDPDTVDLTDCDREPIHTIGRIQSHGWLIVLTVDWFVSHVSSNIDALCGAMADDVIGRAAQSVFGTAGLASIKQAAADLSRLQTTERLFAVPLFDDARAFNIMVHDHGRFLLVEIETALQKSGPEIFGRIKSMAAHLSHLRDMDSFAKELVLQARQFTRFDRVMLYKFLPDGCGEVIAEELTPGTESFLGLRYPASDIPKQARALYMRNHYRLIGDVQSAVHEILPDALIDGDPIDLSACSLRAVSPIHIEYLSNMGVAASLSVSLIVRGELWGLIACHNNTPRVVDFLDRAAIEIYADIVALELSRHERHKIIQAEAIAQRLQNRLMMSLNSTVSAFETIRANVDLLKDAIPCDGLAVLIDGDLYADGITESQENIKSIITFLNRRAANEIYETTEISSELPENTPQPNNIAGLLAIPVSRMPRDYVIFFRKAEAQEVTWAGDPNKPVSMGKHGLRLSPRESFKAWKELKETVSAPWDDNERRLAEAIRVALLEVILRNMADREAIQRAAQEKQMFLINELNHRVKNILSLVQSIVGQSTGQAANLDDLAGTLEDRVLALGRAHDQLIASGWAEASLRSILETEFGAYHDAKTQRVALNGPEVSIKPDAVTIVSLVFHELVTNAVKYGALSNGTGQIRVDWHTQAPNALALSWRETGGPPVQPPTETGFGSKIVTHAVPHELNGETELRFALLGVEVDIRIPAHWFTKGVEVPMPVKVLPALKAVEGAALNHVLVLEDNALLALSVREHLQRKGVRQVTVVGNVEQAKQVIATTPPDAAVLDIHLGEATSITVARDLKAKGIPLIFASGYGENAHLPNDLAQTPVIDKPYRMGALLDRLTALVATQNDPTR